MKKTAWSHLPNAVHIDRVLASVTAHPDVWGAARDAAKYAMVALIAWDDCSQYLDMTSEQLKMWYHLTEQPACLLLLPAVKAFEQIAEMELVA